MFVWGCQQMEIRYIYGKFVKTSKRKFLSFQRIQLLFANSCDFVGIDLAVLTVLLSFQNVSGR